MNGQIVVVISNGIEQAEKFIKQLDPQSGFIFILIFTEKGDSRYASLQLTNITSLPVYEVENQLHLEKNSIYVLPHNKVVKLSDQYILTLFKTVISETSHCIKIFLESIANTLLQHCCMVFLARIDSELLPAIELLKNSGGMVIQQNPKGAEYQIQKSVKTIPSNKIIDELINWQDARPNKATQISPALQQIFSLLHAHTSYDFSSYKLSTMCRRINRQMQSNNFDELTKYGKFLENNAEKLDALFDDLLIGVTSFFRDAEAFLALKNILMQRILKSKANTDSLRIWIPGCSSGEEAYSTTIVVLECLAELDLHCQIQIFATDIDKSSLEFARAGIYSLTIERHVSRERLEKFFTRRKNHYKVKGEVRNLVTFGVQNIISDPPFTKLDLLSCRNLLIYLNTDIQKKLLPIFHYSLTPKGILFLGTSEAIAGSVDLFKLLMKKWKIYERRDVDSISRVLVNFPMAKPHRELFATSARALPHEKTSNFFFIVRELLTDFLPPTAVINKNGEVVYTHGKLNAFLGIPNAKNIINIFDIIPVKIKTKITVAIHKVFVEKNTIVLDQLLFSSKSPKIIIKIRLSCLNVAEKNETYVAMVFENIISTKQIDTAYGKYNNAEKMAKRIINLEQELQYNQENLQATIEELQSGNEELQSTNEELQSTNEEIETTKEELLSLNEELIIVNSELQARIDHLASLSADMNNLFHSTQIIALFLDKDITIKRFTPPVTKLINLMDQDIGRPLKHFTTKFKNFNLSEYAQEVFNTLTPKRFEAKTTTDNWFLINILPYNNIMDEIEGVVITLIDITEQKSNILKLKDANENLKHTLINIEAILDVVKMPALVLDHRLNVVNANYLICDLIDVDIKQIVNSYVGTILAGDDVVQLIEMLKDLLSDGLEVVNKKLKITTIFGTTLLATISKFHYGSENPKLIVILSDYKK